MKVHSDMYIYTYTFLFPFVFMYIYIYIYIYLKIHKPQSKNPDKSIPKYDSIIPKVCLPLFMLLLLVLTKKAVTHMSKRLTSIKRFPDNMY
jgi:hypothetical protein